MTGKLFGILLMALIVILAWKWLRGGSKPPAPRPRGDDGQRDERREKVIELEQDADGVYRPRGEHSGNDQDNRTKKP